MQGEVDAGLLTRVDAALHQGWPSEQFGGAVAGLILRGKKNRNTFILVTHGGRWEAGEEREALSEDNEESHDLDMLGHSSRSWLPGS